MSQTEEMLLLMESGIGVREAVFATTGLHPLNVDESARANYERDIKAMLPQYLVWSRPPPGISRWWKPRAGSNSI